MFSLLFNLLKVLVLSTAASTARVPTHSKTPVTLWDGRIPYGTTSALFDFSESPYLTTSVFGQNLTFSELVKIPYVSPSLFDIKSNAVPFEVTISDASIFVPGGGPPQVGFRRAELDPNLNSTIGSPAVSGIKTLHFSLQLDSTRPLNYSHEYQIVFLETADFSNTQLTLKTGTILGGNPNINPKTLNLSGFGAEETLFEIPFVAGWHNFGLVLDFDRNTTQVLYSRGLQPLEKITPKIPNDMAGGGLYHFGVLKKPTGNVSDVVHEGYQESGINEGLIYGGIWLEDSSKGVITLHP